MRTTLALVVLFYSATASAQIMIPSVGGGSTVQSKPAGGAAGSSANAPAISQPSAPQQTSPAQATPAPASPFPPATTAQAAPSPEAAADPQSAPVAPKPKPVPTSVRLKACLKIDDGTKRRLDCNDRIFPPKPNPGAGPAKTVADCRFVKEQDERLACYNGFVINGTPPKQEATTSPTPAEPAKPEPPKPQTTEAKLEACLAIEDGSKERLNCDDKIYPPKPNRKAKTATSVAECRFLKDEDKRLTCYNGFAQPKPKQETEEASSEASPSSESPPQEAEPPPPPPPRPSSPAKPSPASRSISDKLQACLALEDGSKARLDCDDAIYPPKPNARAKAAKGVDDCRFQKEQDLRLACYNGFAERLPKSQPQPKPESSEEASTPPPPPPPPRVYTPPPNAGPRSMPARSASSAPPPPSPTSPRLDPSYKPKSVAGKLQVCLEIEDGSKGRLDCDDAIFPPKPNPNAKPAKGVAECRFVRDEDQRLACYNSFAEAIPKFRE